MDYLDYSRFRELFKKEIFPIGEKFIETRDLSEPSVKRYRAYLYYGRAGVTFYWYNFGRLLTYCQSYKGMYFFVDDYDGPRIVITYYIEER